MYNTMKEAKRAATETEYPTVIAQDQTVDFDNFKLLKISETSIGREESDCYQVSWKNKCIAICVCSGSKRGSVFNYCDL